MLARPHIQASTCLRCQYCLLRQRAQGDLRRSRLRPYSTSQRDDIEPGDRADGPSTIREAASSNRDPNIRAKHIRVGPRLRGRPGAEVREESARLSLNSLGKPTDVIVLRDVAIRAPPRPVEESEDPEVQEEDSIDETAPKPGISSNDILAGIKGENKRVSQDEINKRIDELRPASAESTADQAVMLPEKEYRKLFKTLSKGFTVNQLVNYLKTRDDSEKSDTLRASPALEGVQGSRTTDWRPTVSQDMNTRLSLHWKPWTEKTRQTPREKHARLIMGLGWGLLPSMPLSTPGQLEVQNLRVKSFEILTLGGPSPLQSIAATRNVKIETNQASASKHHVIRITGPQEDAALALEDMKGAIQGLKAEIFDMEPFLDAKVNDIRLMRPQQISAEHSSVLRRLLRDSVRATCQQLTGSLIDQTVDDKITISVSSASQHEDAIRTVLASLDVSAPIRKATTATGTPNSLKLAKEGAFEQIVPWTDSLPFILNNRICSRLTSIAARVTKDIPSKESRQKGRFNVEVRDIQWERLSQSLLYASNSTATLWSRPRLDLSVNIGRLLDIRTTPPGVKRLSPIISLHSPALHYFQNFVPSIRMMTKQIVLDEAEGADGVVIRLKPLLSSPLQSAAHELRLSFKLMQNGTGRPTAELQSVDMTTAESRACQQLPELAADLQVTATLMTSLDSQHLQDEQFNGLNKFIQRVKAAVQSSDPLRMPTTVKIPIPQQIVSPVVAVGEAAPKLTKRKQRKLSKQAASSPEAISEAAPPIEEQASSPAPHPSTEHSTTTTKELEFRVIHIEHEQLRQGSFEEQPLALISRESGRVGGKGLTLSMRRSYELPTGPAPEGALIKLKTSVLSGLSTMGGSMLSLLRLTADPSRVDVSTKDTSSATPTISTETRSPSVDAKPSAHIEEYYDDEEEIPPRAAGGSG